MFHGGGLLHHGLVTANRIVLDNRVRIPQRVLGAEVVREIVGRFTYPNPDAAKAKAFGFRRRIPATLVTVRREGEYLTVPRGGFEAVKEILQRADRWMRVEDHRFQGERWAAPELRNPLYGYQEAMVAAAVDKPCCLWRSPQASGKTMSALGFAVRVGLPTLVIVYTSNLLDQWVRRCEQQMGPQAKDLVGVIKGQRFRLRPITIAMQQTLWRLPSTALKGQFGVVIADEVQLFASATFNKVIDEVDARYVLGVSGDERRADGKEFLIYDQFGDVAAEVRHEDLVDAGYIHEVEVRVVPTTFQADWYVGLPSPAQKVKMWDRLLTEIGSDPERTRLVLATIRESVGEGGQTLVLCSRREYCHQLDSAATSDGFRSGLFIGGDDYREQFNSTLARIERGECQVAVGTLQAVGVGFDLPHVARGIIATPVATSQTGRMQWQQFRGRFARTAPGKHDAVLYYLHDHHVFGDRPLKNLQRWNRKVSVWSSGRWIDVRDYLKAKRGFEFGGKE